MAKILWIAPLQKWTLLVLQGPLAYQLLVERKEGLEGTSGGDGLHPSSDGLQSISTTWCGTSSTKSPHQQDRTKRVTIYHLHPILSFLPQVVSRRTSYPVVAETPMLHLLLLQYLHIRVNLSAKDWTNRMRAEDRFGVRPWDGRRCSAEARATGRDGRLGGGTATSATSGTWWNCDQVSTWKLM